MTEKTPDEELAGAVERLKARAEKWSLNGSDARVSIKLGDLRTVLSALQGEGWKAALCSPEAVEVVARIVDGKTWRMLDQAYTSGQAKLRDPAAKAPLAKAAEILTALAQMGEKAG